MRDSDDLNVAAAYAIHDEECDFPMRRSVKTKLRLAYALNQMLKERKLSRAGAAKVLGVSQSRISALRHYQVAGFSVERLTSLLKALD